MKSRGKGHAHNHYHCVLGMSTATIATDKPAVSQMTIKNESVQTSLGCSQETKTEKERQQSRGYRNPRTGSLHQPDFINEQSAGDTNSRFKEPERYWEFLGGVDETNTVHI